MKLICLATLLLSLTANAGGQATNPHFSPDGHWLAFSDPPQWRTIVGIYKPSRVQVYGAYWQGPGIIPGLSLILARSLATLLYSTNPYDPLVFIALSAVFLITALISGWIPAITLRAD